VTVTVTVSVLGTIPVTVKYFIAKTLTTEKHDTKNKVKFSPNKNYNYWRDHTNETREYQKKVFRIILKENGLI
jgi:hypothetical protein